LGQIGPDYEETEMKLIPLVTLRKDFVVAAANGHIEAVITVSTTISLVTLTTRVALLWGWSSMTT
jgi:hypothetical protein